MSIVRRSFISVISNLMKSALSFATGILIARGLGPQDYGVFAFLLASFTALSTLLDMGSSSAFFSFISKRRRSRQLFSYYMFWLLAQFSLSIAFIMLIAPDGWIEAIWNGESRDRVLVAFIAVFLQQQIWRTISQTGESQRLTVRVQVLSVAVALVHLLAVTVLFLLDELTVERIYYFIIVEALIAALVAWVSFPIQYAEEQVTPRQVFGAFWGFCLPLIPYAWLGMIMGFADTWLLQHYGGAVEQAYYSVAAQFAAVSLIFTTSVLRILWKEVAEANARGDQEQVQRIYHKTNRILFFLGVMVSGFLIPWSEEIIMLMLGEAYLGGAFVMSLMFLYPIHQALGQVNGTMYYALELTKPYVVIGMTSMALSTVAAYFLLASEDAVVPGFGLASTGLALKMVVLQFFSVNFSIWWLSRHQGWRFSMGYQLVSVVIFLLVGVGVYATINLLFGESLQLLVRGAIAGVVYTGVTGIVVYLAPSLVGMERSELLSLLDQMRKMILPGRLSH